MFGLKKYGYYLCISTLVMATKMVVDCYFIVTYHNHGVHDYSDDYYIYIDID